MSNSNAVGTSGVLLRASTRIANDGALYTREQFENYYGHRAALYCEGAAMPTQELAADASALPAPSTNPPLPPYAPTGIAATLPVSVASCQDRYWWDWRVQDVSTFLRDLEYKRCAQRPCIARSLQQRCRSGRTWRRKAAATDCHLRPFIQKIRQDHYCQQQAAAYGIACAFAAFAHMGHRAAGEASIDAPGSNIPAVDLRQPVNVQALHMHCFLRGTAIIRKNSQRC